jgi:hypothetical protein
VVEAKKITLRRNLASLYDGDATRRPARPGGQPKQKAPAGFSESGRTLASSPPRVRRNSATTPRARAGLQTASAWLLHFKKSSLRCSPVLSPEDEHLRKIDSTKSKKGNREYG